MSTRQLSTSSCRSSILSIQTELDAVSSALGIVRPWPRLAFDVPAWDNSSGPITLDLTQWTLMHCSIIVCCASTLSDPLQAHGSPTWVDHDRLSRQKGIL